MAPRELFENRMRALLVRSRPFLLVFVSLTVAGTSSADPSASSKAPASAPQIRDAADDWFDKGSTAYDTHDLKGAETAFLEAWKLKKTPDIAANLGAVELELGKARQAAGHLGYAVQNGAPTDSQQVRRAVKERFETARKLVGAIHVRVNVPGANVLLNGEPIGQSPLASEVFVDPGRSTIEAKLPGYADARVVVEASKGSSDEVTLTLVPTGNDHPRRGVAPAVVLGGVAVAGLATGITLLVLGQAKRSRAQELYGLIAAERGDCRMGSAAYDARCSELKSVASAADPLHYGGIAVTVVGALAAVGAGTYLFWPAPKPAAGATVRVAPVGMLGGGGLVAAGTF